ncbi:mechanosensitive ion channel [Ichthyenterobacterium sp. W332]|uniref:Mechanosensitive ion channel n=1 Tax=Microcosmobacter mediterraneus TaxID=3075607 RepID=A0ABU2YGM1_9FLAO|nr:mechanosensitive ion channel domain-containing protein [Ichthyenterobacterium sp. W332]MDT0557296.1 mechanosensitive ion channel [Ichthyenterobacterium sp. W332]
MEKITKFLNYEITVGEGFHLSIRAILIVIVLLIVTAIILKALKKLITKKIPQEDKPKFNSVFTFTKFFVYLVIVLITLQNSGIQLTAILTASAALLVGIGLALQTFFQDIISGIFILVDQSIHVGDILEIDGKVGRISEIRLRTTRAVTIDNKVLIIPNHKYLTNIIYNWTENGIETRESVSVGVAYGSDIELVKQLLTEAAKSHPSVLSKPAPMVLFTDFADSSLNFKLVFTLNNSFEAVIPKSEIRFKINELFKERNISIPFPQRDVHLYSK